MDPAPMLLAQLWKTEEFSTVKTSLYGHPNEWFAKTALLPSASQHSMVSIVVDVSLSLASAVHPNNVDSLSARAAGTLVCGGTNIPDFTAFTRIDWKCILAPNARFVVRRERVAAYRIDGHRRRRLGEEIRVAYIQGRNVYGSTRAARQQRFLDKFNFARRETAALYEATMTHNPRLHGERVPRDAVRAIRLLRDPAAARRARRRRLCDQRMPFMTSGPFILFRLSTHHSLGLALELFASLSSPQSNAWLIPAESTCRTQHHTCARLAARGCGLYDPADGGPTTCRPPNVRHTCVEQDPPTACPLHTPARATSQGLTPLTVHSPPGERKALACHSFPTTCTRPPPPADCCSLPVASYTPPAVPSLPRHLPLATRCSPPVAPVPTHGTQRMRTRTRMLPTLHCALPKKHRTPCGALYPPGARCRALVQGVGATGRRASRTSPHTLNGACAGGARQRRGASQGGGVENAPARGVAGGGTGGVEPTRSVTERRRRWASKPSLRTLNGVAAAQGVGAGRCRAVGIENEPAHAQRSVRGRCKAVAWGKAATWGMAGRRLRRKRARPGRFRAAAARGRRKRAHARSMERAASVQGAGAGRFRAAGIENDPTHAQRSVRGRCKAAAWGKATAWGMAACAGGGISMEDRKSTKN
ncbi:hypothetical protein GGX14DRAFT_663506 [Mycena pura]|uniref:Uncharacterized protein n=1 Tax=Mycena pura TaxID=153505 RepID=A0AAD6YKZ0_9AGAR|nr:hypothetical protein GGX14DRAFT_663506 [Mycena pura]